MAAPGYTLPVWVAAAARAALGQLLGEAFAPQVPLWLDCDGKPDSGSVLVPVDAAARVRRRGAPRATGGPSGGI